MAIATETIMDMPPKSMRDLAQRLLTASHSTSDPSLHGAVLVTEKLRVTLTRFAGADGFASLLRRALVLAATEVPALKRVKIGPDGRLEGLDQLARELGSAAENEAALAITAHLLSLLVTFIGEPITLKLVREAWPDTSLDG